MCVTTATVLQIDDLDIVKVDYPPCSAAGVHGCKVDQGFYNAYSSVQDDVRGAVASFSADHPSAKLYVTGHSLGGAMSMLAALDLFDQGFLVDALYVRARVRDRVRVRVRARVEVGASLATTVAAAIATTIANPAATATATTITITIVCPPPTPLRPDITSASRARATRRSPAIST